MISVEDAEQIIFDSLETLAAVYLPLAAVHGHVLRQPVKADRDLPPFDRVTMDGVAIAADASGAATNYRIESVQPAGAEPVELTNLAGGCIQVMTGAVLPRGCDTIIPVEQLSMDGELAAVGGGTAGAANPRETRGGGTIDHGACGDFGSTFRRDGAR